MDDFFEYIEKKEKKLEQLKMQKNVPLETIQEKFSRLEKENEQSDLSLQRRTAQEQFFSSFEFTKNYNLQEFRRRIYKKLYNIYEATFK